MDSVALIRRLHQHRLWSSRQLRDAVARLSTPQLRQPFDIGRGNLYSTLVHLYAAEYVWLEALNGRGDLPLPGDEAFGSIEELLVSWPALDRRWERFLEQLRPVQLQQPVRKVATSRPGRPVFDTPMHDVLLHVCTHAHYTIAQAVNMLRQLGVPPNDLPDPQLISMSRQETQVGR